MIVIISAQDHFLTTFATVNLFIMTDSDLITANFETLQQNIEIPSCHYHNSFDNFAAIVTISHYYWSIIAGCLTVLYMFDLVFAFDPATYRHTQISFFFSQNNYFIYNAKVFSLDIKYYYSD